VSSYGTDETQPFDRARFPAAEIGTVAVLIAIHVVIVAWLLLEPGRAHAAIEWGALRKGLTAAEPWRLLTSLVLHSGYPHALWNGLSMTVFAVPLLEILGRRRTALVYLAAGIGGGATAVAFAKFGTRIIGSSGAVSGLFGAWLVLALDRARAAELPWRARVRSTGIAFLVLPSLVNPLTSSGAPISVSSHVGGAVTGMIVGALLSRHWLPPPEPPVEEDEPEWVM
jgi:membrane associated rhomboid family serine protease